MDNIQILVAEDNRALALDIEMMIADLGYIHMGNPTSSEAALEAIAAKRPDLIIMDIKINGHKNGVEVAMEISALKIPLIFITAYENQSYFEKAKLVNPAAFLVKPFHLLTLQNSIELAVMNMQRTVEEPDAKWSDNISPEGAVFIKTNNILQKIYIKEVYWIEVSGNYSYLFTNKKKYIFRMSLKNILKNINNHGNFVQVHKQFIVQIKYIGSVNLTENTLKIKDTSIPIGRKFKKDLLNQIQLL